MEIPLRADQNSDCAELPAPSDRTIPEAFPEMAAACRDRVPAGEWVRNRPAPAEEVAYSLSGPKTWDPVGEEASAWEVGHHRLEIRKSAAEIVADILPQNRFQRSN